jgi:hypothetical protein|tara:strand:+ start:147 stop:470 length:324 start_codon:yes stop_codon:yes gene_type:complete
MESRQRYTEEIRPYDFDVDFLESLRAFDKQTSVRIVMVLEDNADLLPQENGWIQEAGGVLKGTHPFFFVIRFLYEHGSTPLFLEIEEIYADEYLDFILEEKILIDLT